jgi:hypothetical protein
MPEYPRLGGIHQDNYSPSGAWAVIDDELVLQNKIAPLRRNEVNGALTLGDGTVYYAYFTAPFTCSVDGITVYTAQTAAASPDANKVGLYSVATDGTSDLTRVAVSAHTATMYDGADGIDTVAFTASYEIKRGARYATAIIVYHNGGTSPTAVGRVDGANWDLGLASAFQLEPIRFITQASQTDLPSTVDISAAAATTFLGTPFHTLNIVTT